MSQDQTAIQNSLNAGELAPSLKGRTDLEKYHSGCSTARNFFSNYRGGVSSRAGLAYVGTCKQQYPTPPRDIPFQFSLNEGFALEFGQLYMRIKSMGAYVTEASKVVTSVSNVGLFTVASHGYSVGDWVYDTGNTGFSGLTWIIHTVPTGNTFTVTDLFGNVISTATASAAGTVARIYTVVSPYAAIDLPYLKYTQSADVMTLTCVNTEASTEYPPYSLTRNSNTNWVFSIDNFAATITAPTGLVATAQSSTTPSTWYSYVVTAVNSLTGEESVASTSVSVQNNDIAINAGSNDLSWTGVSNADSYNVYAATPAYGFTTPVSSLYGFIGTSLGPSFTDTNIIPDFTVVPPQHQNPFERGTILDVHPTAAGINYSQSTIGYSITTGTGTGFTGIPVAANGSFVGFIITNHGKNYQPGDTVTITDSGGGVATGNFVFSARPDDASNLTFNGQALTFKDTPTNPSDVHREATLALTLQGACNVLNAQSANLSLASAIYTSDATHIYVTYKTPGSVGNAYTLVAGAGSHGTASGATLSGGGTAGTGATATLTIGPESGTYPSVCAYFQQRRVYAASLNQPDTYWMSKPGLFNNMDSAIPTTSGDAITGTPWAQQVNGIQFLVSMPGGLVTLTGKGAWQVNGGSQAAITPSSQTAVPQAYNGCNALVPPIQNNYDILYIQSKGSIARDLAYNFFTNIYTGTDLTVLSNHLFQGYQILQWAWAEEPYKLIWAVRNDGTLLCLTYLKEQDVYAWTRHDTQGLFVGVCSITEPPVDAVYVITQRFVQGAWKYYSERMDDRIWANVEDTYCVDSGLMTPVQEPATNLTISASSGTGVTFTTGFSAFSPSTVGEIIRAGGGKAIVTQYVSPTVVIGDITENITQVVPDTNIPVPFSSTGSWTITTSVSTISGLNHLEGLTVTALADGSVVPNQVVVNGTVTLPNPASLIVVGLPYVCQVQTMYLDHPGDNGNTIQNRRKNLTSVGIRLDSSRGLQVGSNQPDASDQQNNATLPWTNMSLIKERTMFVNAGTAVPLYTGDYYKNIDSAWDLRGQIAVQQVYPLPANVLAVVSYFLVGDD